MAFRDALLEVEEIEQLALIDRLPTHHDPPPPLKASTKRNHDSPIITSDFFNIIGQRRKSARSNGMSVLPRWSQPVDATLYLRAKRWSAGWNGDFMEVLPRQ